MTRDELEALSSRELHHLAVRRAIHHVDVEFFWELLRAIPAAEASEGHDIEAGRDITHLSVLLDGDLTLHGVTKPVTFFLELNGFGPDPYGGTRSGFSATTEINRNDWEVSFNGAIPGTNNAMVLSDKVTINLEIEAVLKQGE